MAKKKNPEQEGQPAEEQEIETPSEDTEEPEEETPAEDRETDHQEESEEQEAEDPAEEDGEEDPQDQQEEQQPDAPAQDQPDTDEVAELRRQLLEARGQNAAYAAGVVPGMVDDAVTLAMAEAAKTGEVNEAAITKAMEAVLKRHPEWKASGTDKPKGGFKLGFDRDNGGTPKNQNANTPQNTKRWNRFK